MNRCMDIDNVCYDVEYNDNLIITSILGENGEIGLGSNIAIVLQVDLVDQIEQEDAENDLADFNGNKSLMYGVRI